MVGVNKVKKIIFLLFLIPLLSFSQNGKVVDSTGQPLPFVVIWSPEYKIGTTTDLDGFYNIKTPEKTKLIFSYVGYKSDTIESEENIVITLLDNSVSLKSIIIESEKVVASETTLLMDRKNTVEVESSVGKSEMNKKNISNAEDGLKKVAGVTIKSNKINVRGLDDRYNQVTVNKFPISSNSIDQKNLDLNLLPKSFIGNIKVRKTYTSNQWSNIAGAQIDVNTNNINDGFNFSYSTGFNSNTKEKLNNSFSINYGKSIKNLSFEFLGSYSSNYQNNQGFTRIVDKQNITKLDYNFLSFKKQKTFFGYNLIKYKLNKLNLKSVSFFIDNFKFDSLDIKGHHFDYNNEIYTTRVTPINERLFLQQILSNYNFNERLDFNLDLFYSKVNSGEKDRHQLVYLKFSDGYHFNLIDKLDNHYFSSFNNENRYGLTGNFNYKKENFNTELGYSFLNSDNYFNYTQEFYNNLPQDFSLSIVNNPASLVTGKNIIQSVYGLNTIKKSKTNITTGIRLENSYQIVEYKDQIQPTIERKQIIDSYEFLPSFLLKQDLNESKKIKFGLSRTTIRPRFRELTPFLYTEMFASTKIQGNPYLQNSSSYNVDLSYEIYPSNNQLVSFNTFGKYILNPIERVNIATASGRLETYQNSDIAYLYGIEIENKFKLKDFTFDYNLTLMYSKIKISDKNSSSVLVTNFERGLQGSTPILSNLDLFYKNIGFVYNFTGKKLYSTGIQGIGDVYQLQRHQLNFVYQYQKKKLNLSFGLNDILNSPYILVQKTDGVESQINYFKNGISLSFGLKYSF